MPSRAQRRKIRKASILRRIREHYDDPHRTTKGSQSIPHSTLQKREPLILRESILKLADMSRDRLEQKYLSILHGAGIHEVKDLVTKTEARLLEIKGIGPATVKKIKEALNAYGVSLTS